jgi:hypothetical protein
VRFCSAERLQSADANESKCRNRKAQAKVPLHSG